MDPFLGEIRLFPYAAGSAPVDWAPCDGRLLMRADYPQLFDLIGTTYGGDGVTTFAVPDLRGRVPVHRSPAYPLGQGGGEAAHVLTSAELPAHSHVAQAAAVPGDNVSPNGRVWGVQSAGVGYSETPDVVMSAASVAPTGSAQAHENRPPFLVLNFCISLQGVPPLHG